MRFLILTLSLLNLAPVTALSKPPNIVLIMADDLGYGDIGCYGSKTNRTPHLDKLAARGIRFTDFHSNGPMCSPTRAATLTGLYQSRFGRSFESALNGAEREAGLPPAAFTIAEALREQGYATGMVGKWHLGYDAPYLPNQQGFDEFRGLLSGDGDFHTRIDRLGNEDWWENEVLQSEAEGYTTDLITQHSVDFIERHQKEPFFLYIPHLAIHFPWQGPEDPPHRTKGNNYLKDKWGIIADRSDVSTHVKAMVESLDLSVGEIVSALETRGLRENTLLIFTSDNGGYREYSGGFKNISDMGPYRGQKATLYEGGHRVPAIISWPGKITPSQNDDTVMTFDLFPTLQKLAGCETTETDGLDLSDLLFESTKLPDRTLFWRMKNDKAARHGPWKLVQRGKRPVELYHLTDDPGESKNLAAGNPEVVQKLTQALSDWEKDVDASARQ
ncbi:MAG: sulfatase-like hydrolase/transferase [Verrucomicrobiales bacterium]|nr:sulfatase-like hydrolase/transferase [Verrucomicrobiales bacterium]